MRKYMLLVCTALPVLLFAQPQKDTVTLKDGRMISGYIYKMDDGKIHIAGPSDSAVYTADEVQTIMFCHTVRGSGPCSSSSSAHSKSGTATSSSMQKSVSTDAGTFSSLSNEEVPNLFAGEDNKGKAVVIFRCNMCGGSGTLSLRNADGSSKSSANYSFTMEKNKHFFVYAVKLVAGEYNWKYSDTNKNETTGKLRVVQGEEKNIVLFEKQ